MKRVAPWLSIFGLIAGAACAAEPLPALKVQPSGVTVSGVSSGGFMAVQVHVAYSASVSGAAALAGGPYLCAHGSVWMAYWNCMTPNAWAPLPATALLAAQASSLAAAGRIDPPQNLARAPVWLFSGTRDRTVTPAVVKALDAFYAAFGAATAFVNDKPAGHGMVTHDAGHACGSTEPPFINDCSYDAAGALLAHLLGALKPPSRSAEGRLLAFDQHPYGAEERIAMDASGYLYIPRQCEAGTCRVHVAFHGCRQGAKEVGMRFVSEAGYNRWADTNRIVVLYPQAIAGYWQPFNPRGCWDWWGYTGSDYATKRAPQMRAVMAMIARLAQ